MTYEELMEHKRRDAELYDHLKFVVESLPSDIITGEPITSERVGRRLTRAEVARIEVEAMPWPVWLEEKP